MNTTCDFLCYEGFKNVYFVGVRNVEGENHPGHTVIGNTIEILKKLKFFLFTRDVLNFQQTMMLYFMTL